MRSSLPSPFVIFVSLSPFSSCLPSSRTFAHCIGLQFLYPYTRVMHSSPFFFICHFALTTFFLVFFICFYCESYISFLSPFHFTLSFLSLFFPCCVFPFFFVPSCFSPFFTPFLVVLLLPLCFNLFSVRLVLFLRSFLCGSYIPPPSACLKY